MSSRRSCTAADSALIHFMVGMKPSDKIEKSLGFVRVSWSANDVVDQTLETWAVPKTAEMFRIRECFVVAEFDRINGPVKLVHSTSELEPFTNWLHWP